MTRTEAIRQALEVLTVIDAVQSPSAEDSDTMGRYLDQETARLREAGLVWWSADAIPDSVAGAFCRLAAEKAGPTFGKAFSAGTAQGEIAAVKPSAARPPVKAMYY
jgi:hypothetical protein